jgi:hypothetical protein
MPRLSLSGQNVLSTWIGPFNATLGRRECASIVNGQVAVEHGYGGGWLNETTIVVLDMSINRLVTWAIGDAAPQPIQGPLAIGGNALAAANNALAISRTDPPRTLMQFATVDELPGFVQPALSDSARDYAYLRQADSALFHHGRLVDARACFNPEFGGETIAYEYDSRIAGYTTFGQPRTELTIPSLPQHKPIPVWTGRDLVVMSHTNTGVILQPWGESITEGWPVYDGITDGPHHARALDKSHVRCELSIGGVLHSRVIDLDSPKVDLRPKETPVEPLPDIPWTTKADGVIADMLPRLIAGGTAATDKVIWTWKSDETTDFGAWLDFDKDWVGLLADNSNGERMPDGHTPRSYRLDGPHVWLPRRLTSGWHIEYDTVFAYADGSQRNVTVHRTADVGYARIDGVEYDVMDTYHTMTPDPAKPKRRRGLFEKNYSNASGEGRFEEWKDDDNGVLVFVRTTRWPRLPGFYVAPPVPEPYPAIAPPAEKATITIRDYGPKQGKAPHTWEATAVTTGAIDQIVWRWRKQGTTAWTHKNDDEHTTVKFTSPGTYEIGVDAFDASGHKLDGTVRPRLIEVTA